MVSAIISSFEERLPPPAMMAEQIPMKVNRLLWRGFNTSI
jgi:hypothetical protein